MLVPADPLAAVTSGWRAMWDLTQGPLRLPEKEHTILARPAWTVPSAFARPQPRFRCGASRRSGRQDVPQFKSWAAISTVFIIDYWSPDAVQWLRKSGLAVEQWEPPLTGDARADAFLDVALGGESARFVVEVRQRAPYPNELGRLRQLRDVLVGAGVSRVCGAFRGRGARRCAD